MALQGEDRQFLRTVLAKLRDEPLEPASPFYEPLYEHAGPDDPVRKMFDGIDLEGKVESVQLFSGFRGSGKTTELLRLKADLELAGYFVIHIDALKYVNAAEPIEISDMLMVLAGAFSDALEERFGDGIVREGFWTRVTNYLAGTEVRLKEAGASVEAKTPAAEVVGGIKAGVKVKFELTTASSFRENLQKFLGGRLGELKAQVDKFFEDGIKLIRERRGGDTQTVFLFDQLEQLRGSYRNEQDIVFSIQQIFTTYHDMLSVPYVHMVYTVPPWLQFVSPGNMANGTPMILLPAVHLWKNDAARSPDPEAIALFHSLVHRRLGDDGLRRLFGEAELADHRLVDKIVDVCGGHFRDLLLLLRQTALSAASTAALPVRPDLIDGVINTVRRQYAQISLDDAKWLDEIGRLRANALPNAEPGTVQRLTRFIDSHLVLYFVNGDQWYDLHPLCREAVQKALQTSEKVAASQAE